MALALTKRPMVELRKEAAEVVTAKNLYGVKARVILCIDRSGSMDSLYYNGQVQLAAERCAAIAAQFDGDGTIEVFAFHTRGFNVGGMKADAPDGFVQREIANRISAGGTSYAPVMRMIVDAVKPASGGFFSGMFGSKAPAVPTYVIFITDGDNDDHAETERLIREAANLPIFWQFVGIGNAPFTFLRRLDDLSGRVVDNADFFVFNGNPPDAQLFAALLNEFPGWLKAAKAAKIL